MESMESTQETWAYEKVEILVNQEGLQYVQILNLYQVGEKAVGKCGDEAIFGDCQNF